MSKGEVAENYFKQGYSCSQAVAAAFAAELGLEPAAAAKMVSGFGGGFGRLREVCGAVSGMVFVLGALRGYGNPDAAGEKSALYARVQKLMKEFAAENGSYICRELLGGAGGDNAASPTPRTPEFYKKRPCSELVRYAADLLEKELNAGDEQ